MGLRFYYMLQLADDLWQGLHVNRENIYSLNKQSQTASLEFRFKPAPLLRQERKKLKEPAKWQQNIQPITVLTVTAFEIPNRVSTLLPSKLMGECHCLHQCQAQVTEFPKALSNKPSTHSAYTNRNEGGKLRMLFVYFHIFILNPEKGPHWKQKFTAHCTYFSG